MLREAISHPVQYLKKKFTGQYFTVSASSNKAVTGIIYSEIIRTYLMRLERCLAFTVGDLEADGFNTGMRVSCTNVSVYLLLKMDVYSLRSSRNRNMYTQVIICTLYLRKIHTF